MNRRKMLLASGVAFSTAIAGCADDTSDGGDGTESDDGTENGNDTDTENGNDSEESSPEPDEENGNDENEDEDTENDGSEDVNEPDPQSFSGSGADVKEDVSIAGNLTVIDAEHDGDSNFQVSLADGSEFNDNFVNAIGAYDGATAALIDGGEYLLDVEADGNWEVEIRQPRAASGDSLPQSLGGNSPDVLGPIEFGGTHTATGEHQGQSNFAVHVYPAEGSFGELVFNEIGEYDGSTTFNFNGVGWVAVQADGEWSLELE